LKQSATLTNCEIYDRRSLRIPRVVPRKTEASFPDSLKSRENKHKERERERGGEKKNSRNGNADWNRFSVKSIIAQRCRQMYTHIDIKHIHASHIHI